jgi:hypothetical protein
MWTGTGTGGECGAVRECKSGNGWLMGKELEAGTTGYRCAWVMGKEVYPMMGLG